jgi:hypothetical protein
MKRWINQRGGAVEVIGNIYENPKIHPTTHPIILGILINRLVWSRWGESNSRPADYESAALPLSYTGIWQIKAEMTPMTAA